MLAHVQQLSRSVCSTSAQLPDAPPGIVERGICSLWGIGSLREIGFETEAELIAASRAQAASLAPVLSRAAVLSEPSDRVRSRCAADALAAIMQVPCLADVGSWTCWDSMYLPLHGSLRSFVSSCTSHNLLVVEGHIGRFFRLDPSSSAETFLCALASGDSWSAAVSLLSVVIKCGGISHAPLALLRSYIARWLRGTHVMSDAERCSILVKIVAYLPAPFHTEAALVDIVLGDVCSALHRDIVKLVESSKDWHHALEALNTLGMPISTQSLSLAATGSLQRTLDSDATAESPRAQPKQSTRAPLTVKDTLDAFASTMSPIGSATSAAHAPATSALPDVAACRAAIAAIRRDEFGLASDKGVDDSDPILRKQHARLSRALEMISKELYSLDSHALLELLQNADDNRYDAHAEPTFHVVIEPSAMWVLNNEVGFSAADVRSLCDVGKSTKKFNAELIGEKGIGFKSVFSISDRPLIVSAGFSFQFDATAGSDGNVNGLGYVLPHWVESQDVPCQVHIRL